MISDHPGQDVPLGQDGTKRYPAITRSGLLSRIITTRVVSIMMHELSRIHSDRGGNVIWELQHTID